LQRKERGVPKGVHTPGGKVKVNQTRRFEGSKLKTQEQMAPKKEGPSWENPVQAITKQKGNQKTMARKKTGEDYSQQTKKEGQRTAYLRAETERA